MPESMFDKLGDLLSEALDSGKTSFREEKKESVNSEPKKDTENSDIKTQESIPSKEQEDDRSKKTDNQQTKQKHERAYTRVNEQDKHNAKQFMFDHFAGAFEQQDKPKSNYTIYKNLSLPENIKQALGALSLPEDATAEQAKKAYHEKLMYYHPDKWGDNQVLQKIAREKTQGVINAWTLLEEWFKNK